MVAGVVWVVDTSSIVEVRRSVENTKKPHVFEKLTELVSQGRLVFPRQVLGELARVADPVGPDQQYLWAKRNQATACQNDPSLEAVKEVLAVVPRVLDPDKDTGAEEADPYVLAKTQDLRRDGTDARVVTEEKNDTPRKMSLRTAAGLLGIPSVPLRAFLEFEGIL
ncbi:MAG: DUF4411 family protein [Luteitalea sp.]|nr:DUF4411 family protein [Luteitalea sp.]